MAVIARCRGPAPEEGRAGHGNRSDASDCHLDAASGTGNLAPFYVTSAALHTAFFGSVCTCPTGGFAADYPRRPASGPPRCVPRLPGRRGCALLLSPLRAQRPAGRSCGWLTIRGNRPRSCGMGRLNPGPGSAPGESPVSASAAAGTTDPLQESL